MAITIRNRETEEMIRELGRRFSEGPSAVVRRLAEQAVRKEGLVDDDADRDRQHDNLALERWRRNRIDTAPRASFEEIMEEMDAFQSDLHD